MRFGKFPTATPFFFSFLLDCGFGEPGKFGEIIYLTIDRYITMDVVVKKLDRQGRVAIPAEWRRTWKDDNVALLRRGAAIEVVPIESVPPSALFDSIEVSASVDFTDPHSLRKAILRRAQR